MGPKAIDRDLRELALAAPPFRCEISGNDVYEVRRDPLAQVTGDGNFRELRVFHSSDGGATSQEIALKLAWRDWWKHRFNYVGGDRWPPAGEDIMDAKVRDGRLTLTYCQPYLFTADGEVNVWQAQYCPEISRWTLSPAETPIL